MEWKPVRAGRDHLQQYGRQPAVDAVAELVWNALDAEADEVTVEIETASVGEGDRALAHVTRIVVSDNGHGITPDLAETAFSVAARFLEEEPAWTDAEQQTRLARQQGPRPVPRLCARTPSYLVERVNR
jgi:hypothetical protein